MHRALQVLTAEMYNSGVHQGSASTENEMYNSRVYQGSVSIDREMYNSEYIRTVLVFFRGMYNSRVHKGSASTDRGMQNLVKENEHGYTKTVQM